MEVNFLDELLLEAEQKEIKQTQAYYDLILIQIGELQSEIESNFAEAENHQADDKPPGQNQKKPAAVIQYQP